MRRRTGSTEGFRFARRCRLLGSLVVMVALISSCGGDGGTDPGPTAASLTAEGWTAFEGGDLTTADARFVDALALDADYADAHTGRGWVALRGEDYSAAAGHFFTAIGKFHDAYDARAGKILGSAALDNSLDVHREGLALLTAQPSYSFSHDPSYSASDVRWLVARAALDLGEYRTAADQLALLTTETVPDPEAAGFVEDALALLASLRDQV